MIAALGVLGVNLFVLASGFGLTLSAIKSPLVYIEFLKKRVLKIFPLYWLVLLFLFITGLLLGQSPDLIDFALHFFGLHSFSDQYVLSIQAPFWFIGTIFQLYLLFPILYYSVKRWGALPVLLIAILFKLVVDPFLVNLFSGGRFFSEYLVEFVIGIFMALHLKKFKFEVRPKIWLTILLITSLVGLFYLLLNVNLFQLRYAVLLLIYPLTAFLLSCFIFYSSNLVTSINTLITKLANLSYLVFLTHYLVLIKILDYGVINFGLLSDFLLLIPFFFVVAFVLNLILSRWIIIRT